MRPEDSSHGSKVAPPRGVDFCDPIGFLYREHERIGDCCRRLGRLSDQPATKNAPALAASILSDLEYALPLHVADEEQDLFPLLERHDSLRHQVVVVLELLQKEHRDDIECGRLLLEQLRLMAGDPELSDPTKLAGCARAFVTLQPGHCAIENEIVLPLAAARLSRDELVELGRRMAARRGLSLPA